MTRKCISEGGGDAQTLRIFVSEVVCKQWHVLTVYEKYSNVLTVSLNERFPMRRMQARVFKFLELKIKQKSWLMWKSRNEL